MRPETGRLDPGTRLEVDGRPLRLSGLVTGTTWSGSHEAEGMPIARGPRLRPGERLEEASIRDVAPTILTLPGYPVAEAMDGRVLAEAFREPPAVPTVASCGDRIPSRQAIGRADRGIQDRLRTLGYVR